ncbi:MAG: class I SAM-dependent methyltransferase [Nitrospirae bacterium]|nr:class I SAM-dependent methyltransferase [Nitrospirota bacterium]
MTDTVVCSICQKPLTAKLFGDIHRLGKIFEVYFCDLCKMGITVPTLGQEELSVLYAEYRSDVGKRFNPLVEYIIRLFRIRRKNVIERFIKKGRILDIGCGRGLFLHIMAQDGWDVVGTEFDNVTAKCVSSIYNIKVVSDKTGRLDFPANSFDVITVNHVLEHMHDPLAIIRRCLNLLREDGYIYMAVPNILSLQAVFGKRWWFHLDPPYHLNHFTPKGLCKLLTDNSFRIISVNHFNMEYNPYGWLQTLLNRSFRSVNAVYLFLKSSSSYANDCSKASLFEVFFTLLLLPVYIPLSFALSLIEAYFFKRGGTIEVLAVKDSLKGL